MNECSLLLAFDLNEPNYNRRIYPSEMIKAEMDRLLKKKKIPIRLGPKDMDPDSERYPDPVGYVTGYSIVSVTGTDSESLIVSTVITDSAIWELIRTESVSIGFRGMGDIEVTENGDYVVKDYVLECFDLIDNDHFYVSKPNWLKRIWLKIKRLFLRLY